MPIKTLKLIPIPLLLFWGCDCRQSVSGAVVDKQTNHPLDSAAVFKLNKPYDEAVSDTSGFFEVSSISGGLLGCPPMTIIVSKAGYQTDTIEIENGGSDTIRLSRIKEIE